MKKLLSLHFFLCCFCLSFAAGNLKAVTTPQKMEVEKSFLPKSFKAEFKQTYRSSLTGDLKSSTGKIDYQYPSQIRFETKEPEHIIFVSNQKNTWYYTAPFLEGEKGELSIQPAGKNVLSHFFDVLKNGLNTNDLYTVKKNEKGYLLIFSRETKKSIGMEDALLTFNTKMPTFLGLKDLTLTYTDRKKVKLTLSKIEVDFVFEKGYFFFKVPENTKIIKH